MNSFIFSKIFSGQIFSQIRYVLIIFSLLLFSCAVNPVTGEKELMLMSEQQEITMGKEVAPSLRWEFGGYYRDTELEGYLNNIVKELWKISERSHLPVQFHIQNSSVPNAFAIPGHVAITRGLLVDMENEAQFAAVMGHEIGHVMARHSAKRMSQLTLQQIGLAIGAAALEEKSGGDALLKLGAIGSSLYILRYGRQQELQADRLGVKYMSRIGYDPYQAISAHKVLEKSVDKFMKRENKSPRQENFMSEILSTHPRSEVRLTEIEDMIGNLPPYRLRGDGKYNSRFLKATKKIRETNKAYIIFDKAEREYNEDKFDDSRKTIGEALRLNSFQPPFHNLLGLISIQQKKYDDAKIKFDKALSINPEYQPAIYGKALVGYYKGQYRNAIDEADRSLRLFPGHLQSVFVTGKSYYKLRQYSKAVPYLKKIAQAAPRQEEVHGLLGICYDRRGEIRSAVIEYKNQIIVAPDTELGRHAKKRLTVLQPLSK